MASEAENAATRETTGAWTDETNLTGAHDSNCMTTTGKDEVSGEFSFGFTDVDGTIDGIEVLIHTIAGDGDDFLEVELYDSVSTWRLKSAAAPGSGSQCTDCVDRTVGGSSDLWGGTWTPAHIKSTSFRIRITSKASGKAGGYWAVDYVQVTVYYTTGPILRSASASMSMTGATKKQVLFSRKASAAISLTGATAKLVAFFRSVSAAVSAVGATARQITVSREASGAVSMTGATARTINFSRKASAAISAAAATVREIIVSRYAAASMSATGVAKRSGVFGRLASAAISTAAAAKGAKVFFRQASAAISLAAATAKQVLYKRGVTGAISLAADAARQAVLSRSASASIGSSAVAKGFRAFFREASAAMSLAAATAREIVVSRTAPASVSMVGNAARQAVLSRLASASMGITGATARVKHGYRSAAATISATAATARSIIVSRIASSSMGVVASARRIYLTSRLASAVMSLAATAKGSVEGVMLAPPVQATLRMLPQQATLRLPPASLTTRLLTATRTPLIVGGGELTYTPQQTVSRMVLPANYAGNKLRGWNQKCINPWGYGGVSGNPWFEKVGGQYGFQGAYLGSVNIVSGNSVRVRPAGLYDEYDITFIDKNTYLNWTHDKDAHKFRLEFLLDNDLEETSATEIYDDDETFWSERRSGTGSYDITISEELTEVVKGASSLKMVIGSGIYSQLGVQHTFSPSVDWSGNEFIGLYIYGANTGLGIQLRIITGTGNYHAWYIIDDFTGWKRFVKPLLTGESEAGTFDLTGVTEIRLYYQGVDQAFTSYLDRTVIDVGQWVLMEIYVPDQLLLGHPSGNDRNCFLYAWNPGTGNWNSSSFLRWAAEGTWQYLARQHCFYLDGSTVEELFGTTGDVGGYPKGGRGETKAKNGGDGPGTITYSSYYGCLKRVGVAFKMPPNDGQDAADAGISQIKLRFECYYDGKLDVEDTAGDNDGIRYGAKPDETGTALVFDGVYHYVQIPNDPSWADLTEFTVLMRIKPTNASMLYGTPLFYCETYNARGWQLGYWYDSGSIYFRVNTTGNNDYASGSIPLTFDTWSLIGLSLDSDLNVKFWKDGNQIGSTTTVDFAPDPATLPLNIYKETGNASAAVDLILIYDRVLSDWEHQLVFQGNAPRYGLVAEWKLEDDWDFGRTTYEFADSLNQYYGLQNINDDWLCLFHESSGVVEWLQFDHTPIKLTVRADENEEIDQLVIALSDPVLMMDMETLTSDGKMKDLSGEGNHGTITGTEDAAGVVGRARSFDGQDDYVTSDTFFGLTSPFSFELWFKPKELNKAQALISLRQTELFPAFFLQINNKLLLQTGGSRYLYGTKVFAADDLNKWWHVVGVVTDAVNSKNWKIYLNGTDISDTPMNEAGGFEPENTYWIGAHISYAAHFNGDIDEPRIYPYALTQAQAQALMKGETRIFSEEVWLPDLTTDTDGDGVPDFLEAFPPLELPDYFPVTLRRVR